MTTGIGPQFPQILPGQPLVPPQTPQVGSVPIGTNLPGGKIGALMFVGKGTGAGPFLQHTGSGAFWDDPNQRLGLGGNTSPQQPLDVTGIGQLSVAAKTPQIRPITDSTTAVQITDAAGTTPIINVDSSQARVGFGGTPLRQFHIIANGQPTFGFSDTRGGAGTQMMGFLYDYGVALGHPATVWQQLDNSGGFVANLHTMYQDGSLSFGGTSYSAGNAVFNGSMKVGIGMSPTNTLDVNGGAKFSSYAVTPSVRPTADGTTAVLIQNASGAGSIGIFDTTNNRFGVNVIPTQALDVSGKGKFSTSVITPIIQPATDSTSAILFYNAGTTTSTFCIDTTNARVGLGSIPSHQFEVSTDSAAKPSTNTWTITSDKRTKDKIRPYLTGMDMLRRLQPKTWVWNGKAKTEKGKTGVGFIAQDDHTVAPELFGSHRDKLSLRGKEVEVWNYQGHNLVFMLVNAVKELDGRLAALERM